MSIYSLTYRETWSLATLLHLPVQPGSVLADWLNAGEMPAADSLPGASIESLAAKGYYSKVRSPQPVLAGLLQSLAMASVNACEITVVIRSNAKANLVRFAQVGSGILQYGVDGETLSLHDVIQARDFARTLLPAWFAVGTNENLWGELPLGTFLLFKHAVAVADLEAGLSGFAAHTFAKAKLLETFQRSAVWLDVFNTAGVKGLPVLGQMPLEDHLNQLTTRGYLHLADQDVIEIGAFGRPLAAALSDTGLCTLTVALRIWGEENTSCGAFLHGAGRLFLIEFISGHAAIQQLASPDIGRFWVENLLGKATTARYAEYSLHLPQDKSRVASKNEAPPRSGSVCVSCGALVGAAAKFCPLCGTPLQATPAPATKACPKCGTRLSPSARFCRSCGQKT